MAKFTVRDGEGEFKASYAHLSEANTYILHSWPNAKVEAFKGKGPASLKITDDEGTIVGYLDCPKIE